MILVCRGANLDGLRFDQVFQDFDQANKIFIFIMQKKINSSLRPQKIVNSKPVETDRTKLAILPKTKDETKLNDFSILRFSIEIQPKQTE
jgi:hypothetical protein